MPCNPVAALSYGRNYDAVKKRSSPAPRPCCANPGLRDIFRREYRVAQQDVGAAGTGISAIGLDGWRQRGSCMAAFDSTSGSLRLTENLYLDFGHVSGRLRAAVESESLDMEEELAEVVSRLERDVSTFSEAGCTLGVDTETPQGPVQVYTAGSLARLLETGQMAADVRIIQPRMWEGDSMYRIERPARPGNVGAKRWVSASAVQPSAMSDDWE